MSIPFAFVLGLAVLLLGSEFLPALPGSGRWSLALLAAPLLALPALLAAAVLRLLAGAARAGRRPSRALRLFVRLPAVAVPLVYGLLLGPGTWLDLADRLAGERYSVRAALLLVPLLATEAARVLAEARLERGVEALRPSPAAPGRHRLAFLALFTAPWLLLAGGADLLRPHRDLFVFLMTTSIGLTVGMIAFVALMSVVLPLLFRVLFGLSPRLPEPLGAELRATAAALGFPGRAVLWFDSGLRTVNALLLGPLPWPRYLVLTDGLVTALDLQALRGVVAHEVGHAQAGHPAMLMALFVLVPLLGANAAQQLDLSALGGIGLAAAGLAAALLLWRLLRAVAHRFEHEADVLSAIALGGAEPCIRALVRVGQVVQQEPERASLLHPSEQQRVRLLQGFARDAQFRARFALRGLRLRRAIFALLLATAALAGWSWYSTWPVEKAAMRFLLGDFAGAHALVQQIGSDVRPGQWTWWQEFRDDLDAAMAIAGPGGDFEALRPRLAAEGYRRGVEVLLRDGPAAARRWFVLATEDEERAPLRRCLLLYCEAASEHDVDRMEAIGAQVRALGCPPELAPVFGA